MNKMMKTLIGQHKNIKQSTITKILSTRDRNLNQRKQTWEKKQGDEFKKGKVQRLTLAKVIIGPLSLFLLD